MRTSDDALREIGEDLPTGWVLSSVQITAARGYSVLLCPNGPIDKSSMLTGGRFPRVFGTGDTVRDALVDAADELRHFLLLRTLPGE